ncbi:unnamed protein product, partial [Allacma fusca]
SLDDSFAMELNLIDEDTIVVGVPTVKQNTIPIELRMLQVNLTDCDTSDQIELLLANDVYGKLLTGKIQNTDSGLTAIETKYGWVLSGECDAGPSKQIITTSMMSTLSVQQLWDLESIGIKDPIETKSKKDLEEDIKSHFLQTLRVNEEGRYQVQLPWVMPKSNVSNNWSQAVKRLMTTTKRLKDNGHYQAYQEEYQTFKSSAVKIMARAKMDLRLWESNHGVEKSSEDVISNVLGLTWDRQLDTLTPSIIKIDQPDIVPQLLSRRFRRWCEDLKKLSVVKIPRRIADVAPEEGVWTLHVFTDASQEAYAAVGFIRVKYRQNVTVRVIQSKARLAPVKATIPRLELLACLIGARLASVIKGSSKTDWKTTFWSDSMTALTWIRRHDSWGTFVNNRVEEIRKLTNVRDWRHVPGAVNPADLPSRGCSIKKFIETEWWTGPRWLLLEEADWPREETFLDESTVAREKRKSACVGITATEQPWYLPTNSYLRNIRVMAWILRWKRKHNSGFTLEPHELTEAEKSIWRIVQRETNTDKTVQGLALVRNQDGLWCVKLKITMRDDIETFLMPVVLPKDHPIVEQLIMSSHLQNLHAGPQTVVMKIREKVWIPNSKKIVHKTLSRCVRVFPLEVETLPLDVEVSNPVMNLGGNEEQNLTEGPVVSNEDQRNKIPVVQTRSGRVIKAPQRLSYMLAGWKLIE